LIDNILNLLFPVSCVICEGQVFERRWGAACPACWRKLTPLPSPFCAQCGAPAAAIEGLCGRCRTGEHAFDFASSVLLFTDTLREILHHLKYSDRVSLAKPLGRILRDYREGEPFIATRVVPVPLHRSRLRERGFNQAELIARQTGLPVDTKLLKRRTNTPSQTGLTRSQRQRNLSGAFEVCQTPPEAVLVVDDVYTTGSTMNEIARTLKRAGTRRVEVLTIARVVQQFYPGAEDKDIAAGSLSSVQ
jgi:ComF family protein